MDKFFKYFEDKRFVSWVLNPDEALDDYWKNFIKTNPSEKEDIELAHLLIDQLRSKKEDKIPNESIDIFSNIIARLEESQKRSRGRRIFISVMKYAAVGLVFFALGVAYFYIQKSGPFDRVSDQLALGVDEINSQLILGDGENVIIKEKESSIEYGGDGSIIINRKDTVESADKSLKQELNQLVVPFGNNSSIKLPDGSMAYLNAGSRLVYPSFFKGKRREVFLIGEGFFEVVPDENMPFIVQTNELNIEVIGTKFNVSAYPSDNTIETVLVEGKVKLSKKGFKIFMEDVILEPTQLAVFERTSAEMEIKKVDVLNYVSWHEGFLNFQSEDLSRIVKKLERYYNISIILDDPMLGIHSITGKLRLKEDKEKVLAVLATTASATLVKLNEKTYVVK